MRSTWKPSAGELDDYARHPITYEIGTLIDQLEILESTYSPENLDAIGRALIEAVLVHLRLLDAFLGDRNQTKEHRPSDKDDVFARHWCPAWEPHGFLTPDEYDGINAQLAHLAARRWHGYPWLLADMTKRCCVGFLEFFDVVAQDAPDRAAAFSAPRARVAAFLRTR
jgi:hypothetical protein